MRKLMSYLYISLTVIIVHGLILFNDGVYWDSWLVYSYQRFHEWWLLSDMFVAYGHPILGGFHKIFGHAPDILLVYRAVSLLSLISIGVLTYRICLVLRALTRWECLFLTLLSLTFPAFQIAFDLLMLPYVLLSFVAFLLSTWLLLLSEQKGGWSRFLIIIAAISGFTFSFTLNSLLVYYGGVLVLLAFYIRRFHKKTGREMIVALLQRVYLFLLPVVYWVLNSRFFPQKGVYSGYNDVYLDTQSLLWGLVNFWNYGIVEQFVRTAEIFRYRPLLILFGVAIAFVLYKRLRSRPPEQGRSPLGVLLFGFLTLLLVIFPYIAARKSPTGDGFDTRHTFLMALPLAIVIIGFIRMIDVRTKLGPSFLSCLIFGLLLTGFSAVYIHSYIGWQARWVKDRSVMLYFESHPSEQKYSTFWVEDRYPLGGQRHYRFYEWASMFRFVWGDKSHVGLDSRDTDMLFLRKNDTFRRDIYNTTDWNPAGPAARLVISEGPGALRPNRLVLRYFHYRLFEPEGMDAFLKDVTSVTVSPETVVDGETPRHMKYYSH